VLKVIRTGCIPHRLATEVDLPDGLDQMKQLLL
jgi:hypothetical protein